MASTDKPPVLAAMNKTDDGELAPTFDPRRIDREACLLGRGNHLAETTTGCGLILPPVKTNQPILLEYALSRQWQRQRLPLSSYRSGLRCGPCSPRET